ncbi:hypothetical protein B296_00055628, partial [Ensete ventricosum]
AALQRAAATCGLTVGAAPVGASHARGQSLLLAAAPARGFWLWSAAPLQGALATTGLVVGGRPYMGVGHGWPPLLFDVLAVNA